MSSRPLVPAPGTPRQEALRTREARASQWAWGLVGAVLGSWLLAVLAVVVGLAPSAAVLGEPLGDDPGKGTDEAQVVLVGVPGLTWGLVDAARTPVLAGMAQEGGAAALVLRGTHEVTCAADAWLTVGAGQRAATDLTGCGDAPDPQDGQAVPRLDGAVSDDGVAPERWQAWREAGARRALAPRLGSLAALAEENGTCVTAYSPAAVVGAARPDGTAVVEPLDTADRGDDVAGSLGAAGAAGAAVDGAAASGDPCRIHLVSTPEVLESDRSDQLPAIDDALGDLVDGIPDGTTVLVAGMGHTAGRAEAQVLVAWSAPGSGSGSGSGNGGVGGGHEGGGGGGGGLLGDRTGQVLSSGSTRQAGLVQLTDLAPTLLRLAGVGPDPGEGSTAGQPLAGHSLAGQPVTAMASGEDHVGQARELAAAVNAAKLLAPWVLGYLLVLLVPLLALGLVLRRRWLVAGVATVALAGPAAAFLVGVLPWWRAGQPTFAAVGLILLLALGIAGAAWAGPWRRHTLGPAAVVGTVTMIVLGVDVLWSARLGVVSVLGLQPVTAGRFYGQGNVGFGIFLGALLVVMGTVLTWLRGSGRSGAAALALGLLGLGATVLNAAPQGGADFGGVPGLVLATGLAVLAALGVRWSVPVLLGLGVAAAVVSGAAMVLDWLRGPEVRTHLGNFVQAVLDGEALGIVGRKLQQSLAILGSYPAAWIVVAVVVAVALVVVRRPRWSEPLWQHPGLWPAAVAGLVAMVATGLLNDSGIPAVGLTLTMLICAALTVLAREPSSPNGDRHRAIGR